MRRGRPFLCFIYTHISPRSFIYIYNVAMEQFTNRRRYGKIPAETNDSA